MIEKCFGVVTKFGKKHKFQNNLVLKSLIPYYHKVQRLVTDHVKIAPGDNNTFANAQKDDFLIKNTLRIEDVAYMLADEKSKQTYMGMVKFRQTGKKKDFPFACYEENQYFIKELQLGKDEVFIDCGAFTGDTIDEFLKHCPEYKQIVAFEPDSGNFEKLKKKHGNNSKITLINTGVYDSDGEILFDEQGNGGSRLIEDLVLDNQNDFLKIQVKSIDNLNLEKITFIKMDIEGAEMDALTGAEKTILRDKPKLAICIYHSNEDMVRIAEYIHGLVPEYKLYVRQHFLFPSASETVLYAVNLCNLLSDKRAEF